MKTKKIYIIRHGQTDYNKNRMVQGRGIDASLNDLGKRQANAFYKAYGEVAFDKVYTSSLRRTQESVQQFLDLGYEHEALSGLDEISWGDHEGAPFDPEMHKNYLDVVDQWQSGNLDAAVSGGESPNQVMKRQKESIEYILSKKDENTILICSHGRAMRILITWLLNYPLHEMEVFEHQNLGLYLLNFTGSMFSVEKANDGSHLNGISD